MFFMGSDCIFASLRQTVPAAACRFAPLRFLQKGAAALGMINLGAADIINDLPRLRFFLGRGKRRQHHYLRTLFSGQNQNRLLLILRKDLIRIAAAANKRRKQKQSRLCCFLFHLNLPFLHTGIYLTNCPSLRYNKKQQFSTTLKQRRNLRGNLAIGGPPIRSRPVSTSSPAPRSSRSRAD